MKTKKESGKILILSYIVISAFFFLVIRLWQLQILQGDEYRKLSEANRLRIVNIPAPRGIIFDRNGIPLVKNSPYCYASVIPDEFDKTRSGALAKVLGVPVEEILDKLDSSDLSPFVPVRLKQGLSLRDIAYIEARRSDFPGLIVEAEVNREYPLGDVGAHLLGYLGKPSPSQLKQAAFRDISPDTFIGQWGVEKLFDNTLRGVPGKRIIEVNALGREIRLLRETPPVKGKDITLSIDIDLQEKAEAAFGERAGALVAVEPETGEILGLISKPSFDPNMFTKGIDPDAWATITEDKRNPMLDRALQSQYPPGSTFKIVTAIAGLEEGVVKPDTKFDCKGGLRYGRWYFGCWRKHGHGIISLHRAIVESCDVYFYQVGRLLGIDKIYAYATALGLGRKTEIKLGHERQGLIPNTQWKLEKKKLPWYPGETFNAAIGQGYVSVTPIQQAEMISTVANGGTLYRPSLIKGAEPVVLGKLKTDPENLELVKKGLFGVVNEPSGTALVAKSDITTIAGKTGTAQVVTAGRGRGSAEKFRDHAWFVAFAPFEKPEIALSVLVEHGGHGGSAAAPIAKAAIEAYMKSAHPPLTVK
jgi:penicillin-binding protein 2